MARQLRERFLRDSRHLHREPLFGLFWRSTMNAPIKLLAALTLALTGFISQDAPAEHANQAPAAVSVKLASTRAALRDLWVGHIFWVREVVTHLAAKDETGANAAEQQVVANAKQIAGAIEPFYGKAASDQLFKLLAGHYGAVKAHAQATLAHKSDDAKKAFNDMVANAGDIAKFLSGANPNLPEATLRGLLTAHGGHHVQQNEEIASHKYAEEARTWEAMKNHLYTVADALADGLAKQFPDKF